MKKDELKAKLDEMEIEYPEDAKKADLEALLPEEVEEEEVVEEEEEVVEEEVVEEVEEEEEEVWKPYDIALGGKTLTVLRESVDAAGRVVLHTSDGCTYHK